MKSDIAGKNIAYDDYIPTDIDKHTPTDFFRFQTSEFARKDKSFRLATKRKKTQ